MTGSGGGKLIGTPTGPAGGCVVPYDPNAQWSYSGAANVSISYANGSFLVLSRPVSTTYTSVERFSACPGTNRSDDTQTRTAYAPLYTGYRKPQSQPAAENATTLVGSEDFSIPAPASLVNAQPGTGTVSWNLHRTGSSGGTGGVLPPGTPPTGTATGTVLLNGQPYTSGQPIPYGSQVDVTNGRLTLTTEVGTLTVYGGGVSAVFKLVRSTDQGKTAVELRMVKGDFTVCKSAFRLSSAASPPKKTVRRLWAQGKGRFRTRGRYSAAAVRGTNWLTADRCDGTLTSVKQGKVAVTDLVKHKTVLVPAGKSYLATAKR